MAAPDLRQNQPIMSWPHSERVSWFRRSGEEEATGSERRNGGAIAVRHLCKTADKVQLLYQFLI